MKKANQGQQFINEVEHSLENTTRPLGMPPLEAIQSELMRMGFPKGDADQVFDSWLANGFRTKVGKIKNWKAALRTIARYKGLMSQREEPPGLVEHRRTKPAQLREAYLDRQKAREAEASEEERKRAGHALRQWRKQHGG